MFFSGMQKKFRLIMRIAQPKGRLQIAADLYNHLIISIFNAYCVDINRFTNTGNQFP